MTWQGFEPRTLLALCLLAACSEDDSPPTLFDDSLAELPETMAEVGLFTRDGDFDAVHGDAAPYTPTWELWSSGSVKKRHVYVPDGTSITRSGETLVFPPGTLLFKTFGYPDGDGLMPIETRVLRMNAEAEWEYAVYAWDDASSATLVDNTEPIVVATPGGGTHTIPAHLDCRGCHESAFSFALGWDDIQLAESAAALVDAGILADDAVQPAVIEAEDDLTRDVLGSLYGNCVHCHNDSGGPSSSFDLRPDVALANVIDAPTDSSATAPGIRVVPGSPEDSVLFLAFSGETEDPEVKDMPPMGIDARDLDSIELLRTWIETL